MNDEYFRFRVEDDRKSDLFSLILKSLAILVLLLAVVVLALWGYKLLINTDKTIQHISQPVQQKVINQPVVQKQRKGLNKEELAIIIKTVLEQMQKEQLKEKNSPVKKTVEKSEDSELLKSLQNTKLDEIKTKKQKKEIKKSVRKKLAFKKIKQKIIKKEIVYNAVVIDKKEVKSASDLARLYASINKISRNKKRKILNSAYTKKIRKEIIIRKNSMRTIKVRKGDTLSSIALRAYGKSSLYNKIFEANPDLLANPNNLRVGQVLRVPK